MHKKPLHTQKELTPSNTQETLTHTLKKHHTTAGCYRTHLQTWRSRRVSRVWRSAADEPRAYSLRITSEWCVGFHAAAFLRRRTGDSGCCGYTAGKSSAGAAAGDEGKKWRAGDDDEFCGVIMDDDEEEEEGAEEARVGCGCIDGGSAADAVATSFGAARG